MENLLIIVFVAALAMCFLVALLRGILRINTIVKLLENINAELKKQNPDVIANKNRR